MTRPSFGIKVDLAAFDAQIDALATHVEEAARPAAQAAAQVLYDEVKRNVQALRKNSGNLDRSIYQVFSKDNSRQGLATYHVSWNARIAPHGHLVEHGHLQRYEYYQDDVGRVRPRVRPEMQGKPRPGRRASQAAKDAYYVTLPTPIQIPGKAFVRRAQNKFDAAYRAAEAELLRRVNGA